jgi:Holliday junction resolvase RusA-like endonuclease
MMRTVPGFVIHGPPRTKKNSQRIVSIGPMCRTCGKRGGFPKVLPSEAYEQWQSAALRECVPIKIALLRCGFVLPISDPISVEALIYRERNVGDLSNYLEAVGDMLQAAGIITDDKIIEDWDGSRRLKDAADPRVGIYITILEEIPIQESLPCQEETL